MDLLIRKADYKDLNELLTLYTQLHNNEMPEIDENLISNWNSVIEDKNHNILLGCINGKIISSCVVVIIPNFTHNQRPYALIENVITDKEYRNKGFATRLLDFAKTIAVENNCYKIMLLTGSKEQSTLNFYKKAGYNCNDKTGFIQWLV